MNFSFSTNNRSDTLAPCGVFCGACPSFEKICKGCASDNMDQDRCSKWSCCLVSAKGELFSS